MNRAKFSGKMECFMNNLYIRAVSDAIDNKRMQSVPMKNFLIDSNLMVYKKAYWKKSRQKEKEKNMFEQSVISMILIGLAINNLSNSTDQTKIKMRKKSDWLHK